MDNLYIGIKLGDNASGVRSKNITINNVSIYNSRIPVLVSSTDNLKMSSSILDARGGFDQRLHCIYIEGNTSDFSFDKVVFQNSPGGGIHIYKESEDKSPGKNMTFTSCIIQNCKVGAYIWSGAEDIKVLNTTIKECDLAFYINEANRVEISKIGISGFTKQYNGNKGAFFINCCKQSKISMVDIDCNTMEGSLFELGNDINDLLVASLNVRNMNDCGFFYATSKSINGLVVKNSTFEWNEIRHHKISFRGQGAEAEFRNNHFLNSSKKIVTLCYNLPGTNIKMVNNSFTGLKEKYNNY